MNLLDLLDAAIRIVQGLSDHLDKLKELVVHGFMLAVQALILVAFAYWAYEKFRALAEILLGV